MLVAAAAILSRYPLVLSTVLEGIILLSAETVVGSAVPVPWNADAALALPKEPPLAHVARLVATWALMK